jgi:glycerophosphoryl diester phosphodiesterase
MTRYFTGPYPRLFAHRGASGEAPENTFPAFRRAVELGIEYVELDVQASRDGHIMVIHDETLERTTNGPGAVRAQTLAELQQWDAGYWFSRDDGQTFPFRGVGVVLPPLAETLRAFPTLKFTIEIKQDDPPIEEHVIATIRACARSETVLLASGHDHVMQRVRALAPDIATSLSTGEMMELHQRGLTGQLAGYRAPGQALQIPPEYQGMPLVTPESVALAHRLGCEVHVWTINDPRDMKRLFDLGVDGVISDFPDRLLAVVKST